MGLPRRLPYQLGHVLVGLVLGMGEATAGDVVCVVSASNQDLPALDKALVVDIFLGRSSRFPDGRRAEPIDQAEGSSARHTFYSEVVGKTPAQIKAHWAKIVFTGRGVPPREVADSEELKQHLAANPNAIGYIERELVDARVTVVLPN